MFAGWFKMTWEDGWCIYLKNYLFICLHIYLDTFLCRECYGDGVWEECGRMGWLLVVLLFEDFFGVALGDFEFRGYFADERFFEETEEEEVGEEDEHGCTGRPELNKDNGSSNDGSCDGGVDETVKADEDEEGTAVYCELGNGQPAKFGVGELALMETDSNTPYSIDESDCDNKGNGRTLTRHVVDDWEA